MRNLLLVFVGGGLGSVLRYLVYRLTNSITQSVFPYGTFLVNIIGCFFIGFFVFYTERYDVQSLQWRLFCSYLAFAVDLPPFQLLRLRTYH